MEATGPTKPEAGGMATSPATAPDAAPSTVGLPLCIHSTAIQPIAAAAVARCVTTNAEAARPPEVTALPALNPNQPNHRIAAPRSVMVRLCGIMGTLG